MKKLFAAALAASALATGAFAADSGGGAVEMVLGNPALMKNFYSDDAMSKMKSGDDFKAAVAAMSESDRAMVETACRFSQTMHDSFCTAFKQSM